MVFLLCRLVRCWSCDGVVVDGAIAAVQSPTTLEANVSVGVTLAPLCSVGVWVHSVFPESTRHLDEHHAVGLRAIGGLDDEDRSALV
jgi:hypothetical protein